MAYQIGDIIEVEISALQPYGAFANADNGYTGLIHISEISSKFVKSVESFVTVGSRVKVKVLEIDDSTKHLKLSLKALQRTRESFEKIHHKKKKINTSEEFSKLKECLPLWIEKTTNQQ
ncbi:MAG: S1 RNA-binding domain-containing protein [Erysipelotrichaceae bacterium]|nr:S1 RNA-binding domain-containing protein [Erysipelotrichaceae bacterium]